MKRVLLAAGMALALAAAPVAAQTRVNVAVGFGVPRPFVTGVVVIGRPYGFYRPYRSFYYRRPVIIVERYRVRRFRHHRHHHFYEGY